MSRWKHDLSSLLYKAKNGLHNFDLNGDTKQGLNLGGCIAQR